MYFHKFAKVQAEVAFLSTIDSKQFFLKITKKLLKKKFCSTLYLQTPNFDKDNYLAYVRASRSCKFTKKSTASLETF